MKPGPFILYNIPGFHCTSRGQYLTREESIIQDTRSIKYRPRKQHKSLAATKIMSKAYLLAKEKYQAVIDDAGRGDYYCEWPSESHLPLLFHSCLLHLFTASRGVIAGDEPMSAPDVVSILTSSNRPNESRRRRASPVYRWM